MSSTSPSDGYVHARTSEEYQRLRAQAKLWQEPTERALIAAGFGAGMTALDVGCGPGEAMRLMGERAGPQGLITGLDIDGAIGREAESYLNATGAARYRFIEGGILGIDAMVGAPFDLCFTRFTLMHLDDPVAALNRMRSWTRPGGHVVAVEYDFETIAAEPPVAALDEFQAVFFGVFKASNRDLRSGRHLPARFRAAGLRDIVATTADAKFLPLASFQAMLLSVYNGLLPAALVSGLSDVARAARFRAELAEAALSDAYIISPLVLCAVARVA